MSEVCGQTLLQHLMTSVAVAHRACHKHVEASFVKVFQCFFHGHSGRSERVGCLVAHVHLYLLIEACQHVYASLACFLGAVYNAEVRLNVERLAVICRSLRRTVNYRNAQVEHLRFGESLENKFVSYAVSVTVRYGNAYFFIFHICIVVCKSESIHDCQSSVSSAASSLFIMFLFFFPGA